VSPQSNTYCDKLGRSIRFPGELVVIEHIGFTAQDYARSKLFYERALAPLLITMVMEVTPEQTGFGSHAGFGADGKAFFWIGSNGRPSVGLHIALTARSRSMVDDFHRAALLAGGLDNGAPGVRPHYHEHYYAAFALDPDGHNIEAVCQTPP
jgi:catechol 2,3-dioxygenase-like lactoylglutathione lyase family enzyme